MCERLEQFVEGLRALVSGLDPSALSGEEAARAVSLFSDVVRLGEAGRMLAGHRVVETRAWFGSGAPSATAWIAARAGSTMSHAAAGLQTAQLLDGLPAVREAVVSGRLSQVQAAAIAEAAAVDTEAEAMLVRMAERETFAALRERCADVRAAAQGDEMACERIRRTRYFRHWTDRDGALRLDARLAPDDGAPLIAAVRARADEIEREARRAGHRETSEAHAADALVSLVDGMGAPRSVVHVHVSQEALARGHTVAGETCRIEGVGPISVAAAKRLALNGSVTLIETDGLDVRRIAHAGRTIPARLRSALEARYPRCGIAGCNRRRHLEIDHIVPLAEGGTTTLENLVRLCQWHHGLKTHHSYRLAGEHPSWRLVKAPVSRAPPIRAP